MELIYLFVGLILGAFAAWLIAKSKYSNSNSIDPKSFQDLDKQKAIVEQQLNDSRQIVIRSEEELKQLREKINFLSSEKFQVLRRKRGKVIIVRTSLDQ